MFCYDSRLFRRDGFQKLVEDGLMVNSAADIPLSQRLRSCRHSMSEWKKENVSNSAKQIKSPIQKIDIAHSNPSVTSAEITNMKKDLIQAYKDEETYWELKSRKWLQKGIAKRDFIMLQQRIGYPLIRLSHH